MIASYFPRNSVTAAILLAGLLPLLSSASPSLAEPSAQTCADRDTLLRHLSSKFSELPVAVGVTAGGGLVEVLTTGDGGTWTILVTSSRGWSCLMAAGEAWRQLGAKDNTPEI